MRDLKTHLVVGLVIGILVNLAFQASDVASLPERHFDLIELSICALLAALAALLPGVIRRTVW
jgi:uncharacterized membrane protein